MAIVKPERLEAEDDGSSYDRRPMNELRRIRDSKLHLLQQLEEEKLRLEQPSDLEIRITMLEGAVEMAESGDGMDEQVRSEFLRRFVEDLRDDHHHHGALIDIGPQARKLPHAVVLNTRDHPILIEDRIRAFDEMRIRKTPSAMERHPAYGRPGYFAEHYKLVPGETYWREKGYDYREEAGFEKSVWHEAQEDINAMAEFDEVVAQKFEESVIGEVYNEVKEDIMNAIPTSIKQAFAAEEVKPVPYGCGDVFVDKDMAKATGRTMRWQMAQVGLQVYGDTPAVTTEWLEENRIMQGGRKRREGGRAFVPATNSAIMRSIAGPDYFAPSPSRFLYMP